jgi:hypothetical protein
VQLGWILLLEVDLELTGEEPWLRKAEMQEEIEAVGVGFQPKAVIEMEVPTAV